MSTTDKFRQILEVITKYSPKQLDKLYDFLDTLKYKIIDESDSIIDLKTTKSRSKNLLEYLLSVGGNWKIEYGNTDYYKLENYENPKMKVSIDEVVKKISPIIKDRIDITKIINIDDNLVIDTDDKKELVVIEQFKRTFKF